jgi:hypothetical protein
VVLVLFLTNAYKILVGRPHGKRALWRDINVDHTEVGCKDMNWIRLRIRPSCGGLLW